MTRDIRRCSAWQETHERPQYSLKEQCPSCGNKTEPAAPARFSPADPYGSYRRALLRE